MKTFYKIISLIMVLSFLTLTVSANGGEGWFIVKRDGKAPGFPHNTDFIDQNNGYYLDKNSNINGEKVLYLTFDAGYENGNVEKILDTLKAEDVKGAFFILSNIINKNTEIVKRMFEEGHLVCNHTKNHKNITKMEGSDILSNLGELEQICLEKTGYNMKKYFRYPEGYYNKETLALLSKAGYKTFFWSMAYADWDNSSQKSEEAAINTLLKNTHPGAVVLLHPTSSTNAKILPILIKEWRSMGYRFGTLDELVELN